MVRWDVRTLCEDLCLWSTKSTFLNMDSWKMMKQEKSSLRTKKKLSQLWHLCMSRNKNAHNEKIALLHTHTGTIYSGVNALLLWALWWQSRQSKQQRQLNTGSQFIDTHCKHSTVLLKISFHRVHHTQSLEKHHLELGMQLRLWRESHAEILSHMQALGGLWSETREPTSQAAIRKTEVPLP